ncbi:MAG: hypothetical protein GEV08_00725, partial [Acidimicrobiia bacterium]|nr:hypothetical protein [Acidimicrobiia bacterium]
MPGQPMARRTARCAAASGGGRGQRALSTRRPQPAARARSRPAPRPRWSVVPDWVTDDTEIEEGSVTLLSPYRVLDLTDDRGQLAGHTLAMLGAEVIAIEPPGGQRARHLGPFVDGVRDPERSLDHWAFNRGKASVVLDLDTDEGRAQLQELAVGADIVLTAGRPGEAEARGYGYEELAARNPALVYVAMTPFGLTGPKAHWEATDLT